MLLGLAREGGDLVAAAGQHRDREAAHSPARTGDRDRAVAGSQPVVLELVDAERGRDAGRPEHHRLLEGQALGDADRPVAGDPEVVGIPAVVLLGQVEPGDDDVVPLAQVAGSLDDDTGRVDPADEGVAPGDRGVAGRSQPVLVVDAAVGHPDQQVTLADLRDGDLGHHSGDRLGLRVLLQLVGPGGVGDSHAGNLGT